MGIEEIGDNVRRRMKIAGLTIPQLSARMGMGTAALSNLLNGRTEPKSSTLLKLADALKVQFDELLADAPRLSSLRFRTVKTLSGREKAERDQLRHDTAIWLSDYCFLEDSLGRHAPYALADIAVAEPQEAAIHARKKLELDEKEAVPDISGLMEDAGVKLRVRSFGFRKTFGLSVGEADGGPAIVVNSEEGISVERQIFTVAHELGHLLLHKGSYKNPSDIEDKGEERDADLFAGAFLLPTEAFKKEWGECRGLHFVDRVLRVKKLFKVSYVTVLVRLSQVEKSLTFKDLIIGFRRDFKIRYKHDLKDHYEPEAIGRDAPNPVADRDPLELDVSDFMEERFARLVREAYEKEIVSMSRAGEMLNLSIEDMRALAKAWRAL